MILFTHTPRQPLSLSPPHCNERTDAYHMRDDTKVPEAFQWDIVNPLLEFLRGLSVRDDSPSRQRLPESSLRETRSPSGSRGTEQDVKRTS